MIRLLRKFAPVVLVLAVAGCAGGWRNGEPTLGTTAATPSARTTPAVAAARSMADGMVFKYVGAGNTVHLAGEFNAWSTSADPLIKGADGTWTITKKLAAGRYPYKFVIDGGTWKDDPSAKESVDDGFGGKNSIAVVGAGAAAAAATPAMAAQPAAAAAPAAAGDGLVFKYVGAGNTVHLAGEFNAWSTSADPLIKGADGTWTITKKLAAGRYPYKFVIDGGTWKDDPSAKESVDDGFGGKNSIAVVGGSGAGAASAPAAAVAARAVTGKPKPPVVTADGVRFTFSGAARSVALCGSFNDWAPVADPMTQQTDGTWTITKKLKPGSHTYKFLVDGSQWKPDEANAATGDDGFGGKNSILVVK